MTVSSSMIPMVSPYTVGAALPFSTALFNYYSPIAKARLDLDDPGLPSEVYDHCHALLIVHLYEVKRGATNIKSQSVGGFSFTVDNTDSAYLREYQGIIDRFTSEDVSVDSSDSGGTTRGDAVMEEMQLDESDVPSYEDDPEV